MHPIVFFVASLWLVMTVPSTTGHTINKRAICPDYSPCVCSDSATLQGSHDVVCDKVPISTIKTIFSQRAPRDLASFEMTISPSEKSSIPADFLGGSRANSVRITCEGSTYQLTTDQNAFRSSKPTITKHISFTGCDLKKQLNFAFLTGFQTLTSVTFHSSKNFNSFQGVPSHVNLQQIAIWNSQGFENLADAHKIALPGLKTLYLIGNELNDEATAKLLKIFAESSKDTLEELKIDHNKLTRVPDMIKSFKMLRELRLENNAITKIHSGSLALSNLVDFLHLGENPLSSIEPNAFGKGDYKIVDLKRNQLTRIDPYVFQFMLEGMIKGISKRGPGSAALELFQNPIECDCHLAWLLLHKDYLLPAVEGAHCSNQTLINDLNPEGFRHCPEFTCPAGIDGKFRNPLTCSSFYTCTTGKPPVLTKCPTQRVFNPDKLQCDILKNVKSC